ncbi:MAG: TM0996/MTH895 family glutaredoxin-like protein [Planctomycetes bacterium]|nr:TM0996/MTH895 family glutaredoxin-like protein [Planctomycetota bacterium]
MKIEILGTGCPKCNLLEATTKAAAEKLGVAFELSHIRDITAIVGRGVMMTPALAVDGKVMLAGRVPKEAEVLALLRSLSPAAGAAGPTPGNLEGRGTA